MSDVLPLKKEPAIAKMLRSRWRVTIVDHRKGVKAVYDRRELAGRDAMFAALKEFEETHPECNEYGETHGLLRCVRVHEGDDANQ